MTYIHEQPEWPHFTWNAESLAMPLAAVRHAQGLHLGRMRALGFRFREEAQLQILTEDLVKSWAIEGERLDPDEVRSSIASRLGIEVGGLPRASRETDGVVEMMIDATSRFDAPLDTERLFGWHAALFPTGHSGLQRIAVGAWRPASAGPMQVVSGPLGKERVHYEAPSAHRLEEEVARFFAWFAEPGEVDPVLVAGLAHFWFVTIHPFEDGNGRIARAIGDMALARAEGTSERYYSLSAQIESERKEYYEQLEFAQRGELDITDWLVWFLGCLGRAIHSAKESLAAVFRRARLLGSWQSQALNERQRRVLQRMLEGFRGHLTTSKYAKLAHCSPDSALRDIRELLESGLLQQNPGGGRSTSYRLTDDPEAAEEPG